MISSACANEFPHPREPRDLSYLSLRKEPLGNSALIEDLDGV